MRKINQLRINNTLTASQDSSIRNKALESYFVNIENWRQNARELIASGYTMQNTYNGPELVEHKGVTFRPVDKRENYIKRCVGLPGDYLELKNSQLYVNGKKAPIFPNQLLKYETSAQLSNQSEAWEKYGIDTYNFNQYMPIPKDGRPYVLVNQKGLAKLKRDQADRDSVYFNLYRSPPYEDNMDSIPPLVKLQNMRFFPNDPNICNTVTDFKKFRIPKKGATVTLTKENIAYYRRIITTHEGHSLKENNNGTFMIDGKKTNKYTFAMNYYWMMGDNRFNSTDARMWGFVPEDHIVGKASMVWYSSGPSGVRWDRIFMGIK